MTNSKKINKIGLIGTGFIASSFAKCIKYNDDLELSSVLTRRPKDSISNFPRTELLTDSLDKLLETSDVIVECSGDVLYSTETIDKILKENTPVVTMNSEFHVTTGSYFADKGYLTEAQGDQPGSLAAMHEECINMGFSPLVYGNMKGYLNHNPTREDMEYWSGKQGISLEQTVSFTDGTKIQIEQAFVANGLQATITERGLTGVKSEDYMEGAHILGSLATDIKQPIADYVLSSNQPAGVFITATHNQDQASELSYLKMGDGPYYVLVNNHHLCGLEIPKTIYRTLNQRTPLLNNSTTPSIGVCAIAKTDIAAGTKLDRGIGSFLVRGEAYKLADNPNYLPIGIMQNVVIKNSIQMGQPLTFDDVDIPDSLALSIVKKLNK